MSDKLERFIREHQHEFDDKHPPEEVWRNIHTALGFRSTKQPWYNSLMLWRAAAVMFLALSVYLLIPRAEIKMPYAQSSLKEFSDVEAFYVSQISEKTRLIDQLQTSEDHEQFAQQFKQLEAMYAVLKEEMKTRPSKKVKDALVLNLLVRIDLLNQQLYQLEEGDGEKGSGKASSI